MIFHVANSWQECKNKEIVKLYACCFEDVRIPPLLASRLLCDACPEHHCHVLNPGDCPAMHGKKARTRKSSRYMPAAFEMCALLSRQLCAYSVRHALNTVVICRILNPGDCAYLVQHHRKTKHRVRVHLFTFVMPQVCRCAASARGEAFGKPLKRAF